MFHSKTRRLAVLGALVCALATAGLPAHATDESESEHGVLEVEVRPAIVAPGNAVLVQAAYDADGSDDHSGPGRPDDPDEQEDSLGEHDDQSGQRTDDPADEHDDPAGDHEHDDDPALFLHAETGTPGRQVAVAFEIDFGDGSGVQAMTVNRADPDGTEAAANAQHTYAEAGDYTITVTATPLEGEAATTNVTVHVGSGSARLGGEDRFATGARLSREAFPRDGEAQAVVLARADQFADALASATLAVAEHAPVLLTGTASVPVATLEEIARALGEDGTVYLMGGESAISGDVESTLAGMGYDVVRIAGDDRIDTAIQVARFLLDAGVEVDEVVLASAANFPDALAGASYAAAEGAPVVLTWPDRLDPRVAALLAALGDEVIVRVAGGEAAVGETVVAQVAAMGHDFERLAGSDRFATSAEVAQRLFADANTVVLATGGNFPDALAGAAHAGRLDAPILLVGDRLPVQVRDYLAQRVGQISAVYVLGGDAVVPAAVMDEVQALLGLS